MPAAVPALLGFTVTGLLEAQGAYIFASAIIGGLVSYGTTKILGLDKPPTLDDPGIKSNALGTVEAIPIVYGTRRVGGAFAQVMTTGVGTSSIKAHKGTSIPNGVIDNRVLNLVLCWCEGEIEGVQEMYFDDDLSTDDKYAGGWQHEHFVGTDTQAASPKFLAALAHTFEPESADLFWSANHTLSGIAYTYVKLLYDAKIWQGGIPTITALVKGIKVLDLRDDTRKWSDNPALCIYDYITNTRYGRGIAAAEIDTQSFIDAANYCDQEIDIVVGTDPATTVTQARYACDALLSPDDTAMDNLRVLLTSCRGSLVWSGGLYRLKIDKPDVSTFRLTEDNIVGGWNIVLENGGTRLNRVHTEWRNSEQKYQTDIAILDSPTYLAADQGEILEARIDLPATTNKYRPLQMAGMVLRQSRYSVQCEVTASLEGLQCEVFDVIAVTHTLPGWVDELFRVMAINLGADGLVRLQLRQYADAVYDLDAQDDVDSPPPTSLPDPRYVPVIEFFEAAALFQSLPDGTSRSYVQLTWAVGLNDVGLDRFQLRYKESSASGWETIDIPYLFNAAAPTLPSFQYYQLDKPQQEVWNLELRAVNGLGIAGDPYAVTLGKTGSSGTPTLPNILHIAGHVSGAVIRWSQPPSTVKFEVWRANVGGGFTGVFAEAQQIALVPSSTGYTDVVSAGIPLRYWFRAVDAAGVKSGFYPPSTGSGIQIVSGLATYANDAAAGAAGLIAGDQYQDGSGNVKVKT